MDTKLLERKFAEMGARAKVTKGGFRRSGDTSNVRLDVLRDKKGEFFDIRLFGDGIPEVLDVQPDDQHLLLLARNQKEKSKFLCGHDERGLFVAAIPEKASVGTVKQAKEALKPKEVLDRQVGLNAKERNRRHNDAYLRQGEFFFCKESIDPPADLILKNEPITRGRGSKPHMCEFLYRSRGEAVWVCSRYPNGVDQKTYAELCRGEGKKWGWRQMMKDATVYAKGRVRHPDHKTLVLRDWCRVYINEEGKAKAMREVAFLD